MHLACVHSLPAAVEVEACSEEASSFVIFERFQAGLELELGLVLELELDLELESKWQCLGRLCAH